MFSKPPFVKNHSDSQIYHPVIFTIRITSSLLFEKSAKIRKILLAIIVSHICTNLPQFITALLQLLRLARLACPRARHLRPAATATATARLLLHDQIALLFTTMAHYGE